MDPTGPALSGWRNRRATDPFQGTPGQPDERSDRKPPQIQRADFKRHISEVRSPLRRAMLSRAASSMSDFYAAAAIVDRPSQRWRALRLASCALWLDPFYTWQLKLPLLLHAAMGPAAFAQLSRSVHALEHIRGGSPERRHAQYENSSALDRIIKRLTRR